MSRCIDLLQDINLYASILIKSQLSATFTVEDKTGGGKERFSNTNKSVNLVSHVTIILILKLHVSCLRKIYWIHFTITKRWTNEFQL